MPKVEMKIEGYYRFTNAGKKFAKIVCDQINEDYPGSAMIKNSCCYITNEYRRDVERRVLQHCSLKN